jgi:RNA polymerase sigma-70 factor (ECF subfamily)
MSHAAKSPRTEKTGLPHARADTRAEHSLLEGVLLRVQSRDPQALAELYDHTVGRVMALARVILRDRRDAEEIVCEVYEQAWQQAGSFDPSRGTTLAWLLTICRSRALDELRRRRTRTRVRAVLAQEPAETAASRPDDVLDLFQRGHAVRSALAALTPLRRQIIGLAYFRGLSHQEIAAELAMPLGTIKSNLRRTLMELRDRLEADGAGDET